MLDTNTQSIIKSTIPVLEAHGLQLIEHFYKRMFKHHPELQHIFNQTHQQSGNQQKALANAVLAYAQHIENPAILINAVNRIAHKHASVNIRPEHYPIVGKHLLASIQEVLGLAADHEIIDAWAKAYQQLAEILITAEAQLYETMAAQSGGWSGFRPFKLVKKEIESSEIISLYLYPSDGGAVPEFKPGQYVSVKAFVNGVIQLRQYSLSDAPGRGYLRLSIKRESEKQVSELESFPKGKVSNVIHDALKEGDIVELTPPFGSFYLHEDSNNPVVLMSAGVGQTPMLAMLNHLLVQQSDRAVYWLHATRNRKVHAFKKYIQEVAQKYKQVRSFVCYEHIEPEDQQHIDFNFQGRVTKEIIEQHVLIPDARYYLCGTIPFMASQKQSLMQLGVDESHIHYEVFGSDTLGA